MEAFVEHLVDSGYCNLSIDLIPLYETHLRPFHEYFASPLSNKLQTISKDRARRGYAPVSTENFASLIGERGKSNDLVEKFRIGPEITPEIKDEYTSYFSRKEAKVHFFPNDWSATNEAFRDLSLRLYQSLEEVAKTIINEILSQQYDSSAKTLWESYFQHHTSILSINHYSTTQESDTRISEHTDVSLFTIVTNLDKGCDNACLQVYHRGTGAWHDVVFEPNTAIVLVGEYLEFVSNERFPAARHRVVNKINDDSVDSKGDNLGRISCAFFVTPKYDAIINPTSFSSSATIAETTENNEDKAEVTSKEQSTITYDMWRKRKIAQVMQQQKQPR